VLGYRAESIVEPAAIVTDAVTYTLPSGSYALDYRLYAP
jgi:hypothetical protein